MSTVAISLAATSAATTASINSNNSEVKKQACKVYEREFNSITATVEQKQDYAKCINELHPNFSGGDIIFFKCLVVLAFVTFVVSVYKGYKDLDIIFGLLLGALLAVFVPLLILLFAAGLCFLIS